jgi:hypothetical protein
MPSHESEPSSARRRAEATARHILEAGRGHESAEMPEGLRFLHEKERKQDRELKPSYATWLRRSLTTQLIVADLVFVVYAWVGKKWVLEPVVVNVWLGATVVQVIGVVLVVTRHLFPQRDHVVVASSNPDR